MDYETLATREIRSKFNIPNDVPIVLKRNIKGCNFRRYIISNQKDLHNLGYIKVPLMYQFRL